jgi:CPA2 family monovalent cation:H+ antiporter-2
MLSKEESGEEGRKRHGMNWNLNTMAFLIGAAILLSNVHHVQQTHAFSTDIKSHTSVTSSITARSTIISARLKSRSSSSSSTLFNVGKLSHPHFVNVIDKNGSSTSSSSTKSSTQLNMSRRNHGDSNGGTNANGAANNNGGKRERVRHAFKTIFTKVQQKAHLMQLWSRKYKSRTLVTAMLFFTTILHSTTSTTDTILHQQQTTTHGATSTATSTSVQVPIMNRGGGAASTTSISSTISSNRPTKVMKNFLQRNNKQTLPTTTTTPPPLATVDVMPKTTTSDAQELVEGTTKTIKQALLDLKTYMDGPKSDTLLLLLATSLITPLCKRLGTSPILGFLAAGMTIGPNALGLISGIHTTETLAELGIVFFLFEMGIELSIDRLKTMKKDVFGLGFLQFATTALCIAAAGKIFGNIPTNALVVLGGGLALSSSAFVLQLLKDNNQLATRFGKAAFGILLFQDLAVVPLLVVTPILAGGGQGLASALFSAMLKAGIALSSIAFAGRVLVNPMFKLVAQANSQEAFLGVVLLTVLSMSFMTEGLGLSNTLGAFLAGVLLSETKYRYQIEADIAPFRGILLGLFFVTVGFEIDFNLIASNLPLVSSIVAGILVIKTAVIAILSTLFGLSLSTALQTGLILCQGGEFAFVAFGLARSLGILDPAMTKLMLTSVALTMAVTPFLSNIGGKIAKELEERSDFTHYLGQDRDANEIRESDDFVVVVGYGIVGKLVCELLDQKLYRYVGLEMNPNKAIEARNKGLPVFYGDIGRSEVAEAFGVGNAKAIIVTIADKNEANRAIIALRRNFPDMKIFARAANPDHAERLQRTLDVIAMVPVVPEDNLILTLPFGGAVLRSLGAAQEEVNAIIEGKRKQILLGRGLEEDDQNMILAQLGIVSTSNDSSKISAEETKLTSPMLAEVIEAAVIKKDVDDTNEPDVEAEVDAVEVDASDTIIEGKEGDEVKA